MITYAQAKEVWIREILSDKLETLPEGFLDDLLRTMESLDAKIDSLKGSEPQRSLLVGMSDRLHILAEQILRSRCAKILALSAEGVDISGLGPEEMLLYEQGRKLVRSHEERFYRFSREGAGGTSPAMSTESASAEAPSAMAATTKQRKARESRGVPAEELHKIIRVVREFPCFVGPDLRSYGPFAKEDIVALPDEVSEILLTKKVAERVATTGE